MDAFCISVCPRHANYRLAKYTISICMHECNSTLYNAQQTGTKVYVSPWRLVATFSPGRRCRRRRRHHHTTRLHDNKKNQQEEEEEEKKYTYRATESHSQMRMRTTGEKVVHTAQRTEYTNNKQQRTFVYSTHYIYVYILYIIDIIRYEVSRKLSL